MSQPQNIIVENQISSRDLIVRVVNFFKFLGKNWRILLISACLGSLLSLVTDIQNYKAPFYEANIRFNLETGGGGAASGGMSALAGALGIPSVGTSAGGDLFSGINFFEVINTRSLIEKILMEEVDYKGQKVLFGNLFKVKSGIVEDEWAGSWFQKPKTELIKYRFTKKDPKDFTNFENELVAALHDRITSHTQLDQVGKSTISIIAVRSNDELLSKIWCEKVLSTMYEYYKEFKTQKTVLLLKKSEERSDSLKAILQGQEQSLASYTNQNLGIVVAEGQMMQNRMARNTAMLTQQYTAAALQTDQYKAMLLSETPLFTIIEPVRLPLVKSSSIMGKNLFMGGMAALLVAIFVLFFINSVRAVIKDMDL